jgi:hypothetical protein
LAPWKRFAIVIATVAVTFVLFYLIMPIVAGALMYVAGRRASVRHEQLVQEAKKFGNRSTAEACIREAIARADKCGDKDTRCSGEAQDYLAWSLSRSRDAAEVCNRVPRDESQKELWVQEECRRRGRPSNWKCIRAVRGVLVGCPSG